MPGPLTLMKSSQDRIVISARGLCAACKVVLVAHSVASRRRDQGGYRYLPCGALIGRKSAPRSVADRVGSGHHETGERTFLSTSRKEARYARHYCLWHT